MLVISEILIAEHKIDSYKSLKNFIKDKIRNENRNKKKEREKKLFSKHYNKLKEINELQVY